MNLIWLSLMSPLAFNWEERSSNYGLVGYLPVASRKKIASGSGYEPPGAFWAFSQNYWMECPLKVIPLAGSSAEPS